ncbi:MAG: DUF2330 domain-containing protein, partial [Planctomycetota bacterium]
MEKQRRRLVSFGVFIGAALFFALLGETRVYGDGKYFPKRAYKTAPAIPAQRAILTFKDGTEKLIIESDLKGEGKEFAWIIPLPARPTDFKEVSPGLFKTLSLNIQPEIIHDLIGPLTPLSGLACIVTLGSVLSISKRPKQRIFRLLLLLLAIIFLGGLCMPMLSVRGVQLVRTGQDRGVTVHEVREVGSYQLSVLEADNADFLSKWLEENDYVALTAEEKPVITDYIRDGFCFVAARLRREADGYSRPHPLAMTFPCKAPMYPMRLTGTVGSDVYLELYVIAEKQVHGANMSVEVSDTFDFDLDAKGAIGDKEPLSGFVGSTYRQHIGHPDAAAHLWDGCMITRLEGMLGPEQMKEDFAIQLKPGEPQRKYYYSYAGARQQASIVFLLIWCLFLPVSIAVLNRKIARAPRKATIGIRIFAATTAFSLIVSSATYLSLTKVSARTL